MSRAPVHLNVYDMYWLNDYASSIGFGIYHTGVEVYGVEYAYGGHPFSFSGIFENAPKDAEELGENFKFRESIFIGKTDFTQSDVKQLIQMLGEEYRGDKYHLISKNCNHFTASLAKTLTGCDIPAWINRLASISSSIPFLERCLPQEWLTPVALQQSIQERRRSGDFTSAVVERGQEVTEQNTLAGRRSSLPVSGSIEAELNNGLLSTLSGSASYLTSTAAMSSPTPVPHLSKIWNSIKGLAVDNTQSTTSPPSSPQADNQQH